jgi:hypothetical protein
LTKKESFWECLKTYLCNVFEQHGIQTIHLLNPSTKITDEDQKSLYNIIDALLKQFDVTILQSPALGVLYEGPLTNTRKPFYGISENTQESNEIQVTADGYAAPSITPSTATADIVSQTGDYATDGGALYLTETETGTYIGGKEHAIFVAYMLDNPNQNPADPQQRLYNIVVGYNSFSGYLIGNITGYSITPNCPVAVSVTIGAFDLVTNRTPVSVTTSAPTDIPFESYVNNAYGEKTLKLKIRNISATITNVGYDSRGTKIYKYIYDTLSNTTQTATAPSVLDYRWKPRYFLLTKPYATTKFITFT